MINYETILSNFNPKRFFRSNKNKSSRVRRSDLSYSSASSEDTSHHTGMSTPHSVLLPDTAGFQYAFNLIDRDGDGKISVTELELILSRVASSGPPPTKEEVASMLTELDSDGDGCISLEEFGAIIRSEAFVKPARESELRDTFDFFDVNRDGRITAEELLDGFTKLGDSNCSLTDCMRMIAEVDGNKDGYVCFQDFSRMMDQQQTPLLA